jgi:hypothetical protein
VWPDGLSHYVSDHGVRLPDEFVQHASSRTESLEEAERDLEWWRSATLTRPADGVVAARAGRLEHPGDGNQTVLSSPPEPVEDLAALEGRKAVVEVVEALQRELQTGLEEPWENDTLERFLDGFGALLGAVGRSCTNTGRAVPTDPWVLVADALKSARYYE